MPYAVSFVDAFPRVRCHSNEPLTRYDSPPSLASSAPKRPMTPCSTARGGTWSVESQLPRYAIPVSEYPFSVSPFVKRTRPLNLR